MDNRIKCSVNNCSFWHKGNQCSADSIMVTSDSNTSATQDPALLSSASTPAGHSSDTCCNTFRDKGSRATVDASAGLLGSYHGGGSNM